MAENIRKREATKKRIQDAMMVLYSQVDFQKITVSMICSEAGLHRSTFYLYYNSTDELLREIEHNILDEIQHYSDLVNDFDFENDSLSPQEIFDLMTPEMVRFYNWQFSMRSYLTPLLGSYGDPYFIQHYEEIIHYNIRPAVEAFGLNYADKPYVLNYLVGGVLKTNKDWLENNDITVEELVAIQRRMVFNNPFA